MAQRGRQSAAALAVVKLGSKPCPEPPQELTPEQAEIWRAVTKTKPADWFTADTFPLLTAYCRLTTSGRVIEKLIAAFDPAWAADEEGLDRYSKLMRLQAQNAAGLAQLATKMRLAQQSRYNESAADTAARHAVAGTKPWQRRAAES